jgi:hypothetical protein
VRKKKWVFSYLLPLAFGVLLLLIPLLRDVHLESAFLVSILITFWGGWKSARLKRNKDLILLRRGFVYLLLIVLPLLLHGLINDCLTLDGLMIWGLLPVPSLFFGIAIGRFYRILKIPAKLFLTISTLLLIALGVWLIEFFQLPQVYYFNHVWGYWPGPIYDEEIKVTAALFWFRASTMLWVLLLWVLPSFTKSTLHKILSLTSATAVLLIIFFHPTLGISTPRSELQLQLNGVKQTSHFNLYYDPEFYSEDEIQYWAQRHEFHFDQIVEQLQIDWPADRKIESYLYNHAWHKKELVGAKFTSYVPVWLEQDQLHIAKEHLEGVLKHELVHVIAKQFGNDLLNASWSIGLIEGVAEAIARDASDVSTLDQIIAAEQPLPTADQMRSALSIFGFYGSASAISYTTTGSFVSFLLDNYPIDQFKAAYPTSDFESSYSVPFDTLVARWKNQLPLNEVDSVDQQVSQFVFSQQSLFQVSCPRKTHPVLQGLDRYQFHEANQEPLKSLEVINELYKNYSELIAIQQLWARKQLEVGSPSLLLEAFSESDTIPSFHLLKADAMFQTSGFQASNSYLNRMSELHFPDEDIMLKQSLEVRSDSLSWKAFYNARYNSELSDPELFQNYSRPLQWLLVDRALRNYDQEAITQFAQLLVDEIPDPTWFDTQERLVYMLVYYQQKQLAKQWIDSLSELNLRARYQERIHEMEEWAIF